MFGDPMTLGVRVGGAIQWLPSGTSFVLTEEMANSGLYINPMDTGTGSGEFYASNIMVNEGEEELGYEPPAAFDGSLAAELRKKLNEADIPKGGLVERTWLGWKKVGYSSAAAAGSLAMRDAGGKLAVGRADGDSYAVPLSQLNEILNERIGDISAALDEVLALQEFYTGDTFDELHEYADGVIAGG